MNLSEIFEDWIQNPMTIFISAFGLSNHKSKRPFVPEEDIKFIDRSDGKSLDRLSI